MNFMYISCIYFTQPTATRPTNMLEIAIDLFKKYRVRYFSAPETFNKLGLRIPVKIYQSLGFSAES